MMRWCGVILIALSLLCGGPPAIWGGAAEKGAGGGVRGAQKEVQRAQTRNVGNAVRNSQQPGYGQNGADAPRESSAPRKLYTPESGTGPNNAPAQ